jgi:putative component of toxin-antitoxin plasmid stabilization module
MKRINYRPVDRVYFKKQEFRIVILLASGDKRSQANESKNASDLARTPNEGIMASPSTRS